MAQVQDTAQDKRPYSPVELFIVYGNVVGAKPRGLWNDADYAESDAFIDAIMPLDEVRRSDQRYNVPATAAPALAVSHPTREGGQDPRKSGLSLDGEEWEAVRGDRRGTLSIGAQPVRWPWSSLDALTGGMQPGGRPIYIVGYSGIGKSTFLRSCLLEWSARGIPVDVLPLETTAERFALDMASLVAGVDPGVIASGDYAQLANGDELKANVDVEMRHCVRDLLYDPDRADTWRNPLHIHRVPRINVGALRLACERARERGARILVIDHIDHIHADGGSSFEVSRDVNNAAMDLGREMGLLMVLMSQANNEALKGNPDHLARYAPLRPTAVWMGQLKIQNAATMIGQFRPLRERHAEESPEMFAEQIKRARRGDEPPENVLVPNAMGLSLLKSENYGSRVGRRMLLGWKAGRVNEYEGLPYSMR